MCTLMIVRMSDQVTTAYHTTVWKFQRSYTLLGVLWHIGIARLSNSASSSLKRECRLVLYSQPSLLALRIPILSLGFFHSLRLLLGEPKRSFNSFVGASPRPDILAVSFLLHVCFLLPISVSYRIGTSFLGGAGKGHAEAPICPMLTAGAQGAVTVDVVEVTAKGRAVECGIEGGAT